MADIAQVIATGGTALVSAAAGAGLTYWLGALNRRHQEVREDKTRWYEARFGAYSEFTKVAMQYYRFFVHGPGPDADVQELVEELRRLNGQFLAVSGVIRLVASPEVLSQVEAVAQLTADMATKQKDFDINKLLPVIGRFETAARKDLGHPIIAKPNAK